MEKREGVAEFVMKSKILTLVFFSIIVSHHLNSALNKQQTRRYLSAARRNWLTLCLCWQQNWISM